MGQLEPSQRVKVALFTLSGNECAFPNCIAPMFADDTIVGQICHIRAQSPGGPRYDPSLSAEEVHAIANLILLCGRHHKTVDDHPDEYTPNELLKMKIDHEWRTGETDGQLLRKLVDALVPSVPDDWTDRPGAPVFQFDLASSRPQDREWTFHLGVRQISGSDVGKIRYRYRLGSEAEDSRDAELRPERKWKFSDMTFTPKDVEFEVEFRFWWDGAERTVTRCWASESEFQSASWVDRSS